MAPVATSQERQSKRLNGHKMAPSRPPNGSLQSIDGAAKYVPLVDDELLATQHHAAMNQQDLHVPKGAYLMPNTRPPVFVSLETEGQSTLRWEHPIFLNGIYVPVPTDSRGLNLYTYPSGYKGEQLELLSGILLHLGANTAILEQPDAVGAYPIHALLIADTPEAHALVIALLELNPALMLQVHSASGPFAGEGCLHILCVNQREELACRMVELAELSLTREQLTLFLTTQAEGPFFESRPMKYYGETPLAYACVFGLRELVKKMLRTECVRFDTAPGKICGFYPIHAVAASGNRSMYDWILEELSPSLRAGCSDKRITSGRLIQSNMEGMGPLQLTCKMGLRRMFQHIMKKQHTKMLWKWGPITAYSLDLEGIDSSGDGAADVMEIIGRQRSSRVTQSLILDNMMQGFLYKLFQQKWRLYAWYIHYLWCALDLGVIVLIIYNGLAVKAEMEKFLHSHFYLMLLLFMLSLSMELFVALLYAANIRRSSDVGLATIARRTYAWMGSFQIDTKLLSYAILTVAAFMYLYTDTALEHMPYADPLINVSFPDQEKLIQNAEAIQDAAEDYHAHGRQLKRGGGGQNRNPLLQAAQFGYDPRDQKEIEVALLIESSQAAAIGGSLPLVWLLLGSGCILQLVAFVEKFTMPIPALSTLILSVKSTLRGELLVFMFVFLMAMGAFFITMFIIYPRHESTHLLPQAPDFAEAWSGAEAMVLLAFIGQSFDLNLNPAGLKELGEWQVVSTVAFVFFYYYYAFFSLILLLNLLIALLGDSFAKTQAESILEGRIAVARCILRLELIADFFGVNTRAGEVQGDTYVHVFREVSHNKSLNEVSVDEPDENIFDNPDGNAPEWATRLMEKIDSIPKLSTDLLMHEIAEGDRQRREDDDQEHRKAVSAGRRGNQLPPPAVLQAPSDRSSPSDRKSPSAQPTTAAPRSKDSRRV